MNHVRLSGTSAPGRAIADNSPARSAAVRGSAKCRGNTVRNAGCFPGHCAGCSTRSDRCDDVAREAAVPGERESTDLPGAVGKVDSARSTACPTSYILQPTTNEVAGIIAYLMRSAG